MQTFDVTVIGAGPGGYVAAIRAAQNGLKVAVIERDTRLGGTCLLRGCIPTKSLLHAADLYTMMSQAKSHGIIAKDISVDFSLVQKAREEQVQKGATGVAYLMKKNNITQIRGHARLTCDAGVVEVEDLQNQKKSTVKSNAIIVATGSVPRAVKGFAIDGEHIVTSDHLLQRTTIPKSMVVLGAGAVGVEFASVFSRFGTACTIVEMQKRLVPNEDEDISLEFAKALKKRGIKLATGSKLSDIKVAKGCVRAILHSAENTQEEIEAEVVLVAIGRAPVTADIGAEHAKIALDDAGYIKVDTMMQTSRPQTFAIGDVVRTPWLAHVASAEGIVAADFIANKKPQPLNYKQVPGCTYSDPEIASVGLSEDAAKKAGFSTKVGKYPFSAVPKARILGVTEGLIKVVSESQYGEILGVHMMGPHATDLIAEACLALKLECTLEELATTIHAHPTLAEGMLEATHAAMGHALHL